MKLLELFDKPADAGWSDGYRYGGGVMRKTLTASKQMSDGTEVRVAMEASDAKNPQNWHVMFTRSESTYVFAKHQYSKTFQGLEMEVFSFVMGIIRKLISRYDPNSIMFSAATNDKNDPQNKRVKLYTAMVKRYMPSNYTFRTQELPDMVNFVISKVKEQQDATV